MYHQMNNEQKNTYVKQQLTRALLELLQKKTLAEISRSEEHTSELQSQR